MGNASFRGGILAGAATLLIAAPDTAQAESFAVPAGRLGDVVIALGVQARTTIVLAEPDLAGRRSPGVKGRMSLREALDSALKGTGTEAVFAGPGVVRIQRRRPQAFHAHPAAAALPPAFDDTHEIVVSASKQDLTLGRYPGSVKIVKSEEGWLSSHAAEGSAAITRLLPVLGSTNLGMGRNKLFIRGISDSSFSGPTQATTGQYLGDIRLTYNAPDPDLNLYDVERFEVMVGPQGTLYGAGSLGGIIRIVPNAPDPGGFSGTGAVNGGITRHGGASFDGAAMLNIPLARDRVAVRFVGYGAHTAGYIDAPQQGKRDINSTTSYGQRLSVRAEDIGGWTIDLGQVVQNISTGDGQYTLQGDPPLTRSGLVAQPFDNNYRLGYLSATRSIGDMKAALVTSVAHHDLSSIFDATGYDGTDTPARYAEQNTISLTTQEARLSGGGSSAPWVAGLALTRSVSRFSLSIGSPDRTTGGAQIRNRQLEAAIFGEATRPLSKAWGITLGGRLTFAGSSRKVSGIDFELPDPHREDWRFSGTFALNWTPEGPLSSFVRYQQGYRPGGLGFTLSDSTIVTRQFAADDLRVVELGVRWGNRTSDRLSVQSAIFIANWRNIQADLIGDFALPYTANIGTGVIKGLDLEATWKPTPSIAVNASLFLNDSQLVDPTPEYSSSGAGERNSKTLPNVARNGGRIAIAWQGSAGADKVLRLNAAMRYVGRSYLGLGERLDIPQGDYLVGDIDVRLQMQGWGVALSVSNIGDVRSNTFAYGNPFGVARRDQITPLRPLTAKLGIDIRY